MQRPIGSKGKAVIEEVVVATSTEAMVMDVAVGCQDLPDKIVQHKMVKRRSQESTVAVRQLSIVMMILCRDNMYFCYPISHTEVNVQYSAVCRFDTSHSRGADSYFNGLLLIVFYLMKTLGGPQSGVFITKNMFQIMISMQNCSTIKVILVF